MDEKKYLRENQELRSARQQRHAKEKLKRVPFNLHTVHDIDILEKLKSVGKGNVQGYLKELIRKDIRGEVK